MKTTTKYAIIGVLVLGLILISVGISGMFTGLTVSNIENNINLVQFTHGEISCIPLSSSIQDSQLLLLNSPSDISCQKTFKVTTDSCDIKLRLEDNIFAQREIEYQICTINGNLYTSTDYSNCVSVKKLTNDVYDSGSSNIFRDKKGSIYRLETNFPSNKVLRITNIHNPVLFDDFNDGLFSTYVTYRPFKLYRHDVLGGNGILQGENCIQIPDISRKGLVVQATESGEYNKLFNFNNYMYANERFDYISQPVLVPFSQNRLKLINEIYGYCQNKQNIQSSAYFSIEKVTTSQNLNYYYVSHDIIQDNVVCCDGDKRLGQTCQNNQWIDDVSLQCSLTVPCPIKFETKYGEKQVYYQKCNSGKCDNVVRNVECTQNSDCNAQQGGVCRTDFTCYYISSGCKTNNDCLEGEQCVNAVCEQKSSNPLWLWVIIGGVLIATSIVIFRLIKRK